MQKSELQRIAGSVGLSSRKRAIVGEGGDQTTIASPKGASQTSSVLEDIMPKMRAVQGGDKTSHWSAGIVLSGAA